MLELNAVVNLRLRRRIAIIPNLEPGKIMLANSRRCLCVVLLILGCLSFEEDSSRRCFAASPLVSPLALQDSQSDELSDEEAKSIKIADRFFSILEKSPRRGTALERVYGPVSYTHLTLPTICSV